MIGMYLNDDVTISFIPYSTDHLNLSFTELKFEPGSLRGSLIFPLCGLSLPDFIAFCVPLVRHGQLISVSSFDRFLLSIEILSSEISLSRNDFASTLTGLFIGLGSFSFIHRIGLEQRLPQFII